MFKHLFDEGDGTCAIAHIRRSGDNFCRTGLLLPPCELEDLGLGLDSKHLYLRTHLTDHSFTLETIPAMCPCGMPLKKTKSNKEKTTFF